MPHICNTIDPNIPLSGAEGLDGNSVISKAQTHPPAPALIEVHPRFLLGFGRFLPFRIQVLGHGAIYPGLLPKLRTMAGLYVHVPFCAQACSYCDFHFTTKLSDRDAMVDAMVAELKSSLPEWEGETFTTLYFGGGTPSVLGADAIARIAHAAFDGAKWALEEWTLEANPEDLTPGALQRYKEIGVTRLSIGVQSFKSDVLVWMKRIHSVNRAETAVLDAASTGFNHISLDLMYGLPLGAEGRWMNDVEKACALPVDHLSCYILTAEPRTLYGHELSTGQKKEPEEDQVVQEYAALCGATAAAGFEHYEVSNFARNGGRSRHNSAYWQGTPYLGIGPGAHSFRGNLRWWNARSNGRYLQQASRGAFKEQRESEQLDAISRFNEFLITGLRRLEGVDPDHILEQTGVPLETGVAEAISKGDCEWEGGRLRIPEPRWPMGDTITLGLMR